VELRREPLDGPAASALIARFEAEIAALYPGWSPAAGPTADPADFREPSGLFLVAYEFDQPVACGGFKHLNRTDAEVKRIFVAPSARGRGVAATVLGALEDGARDAGYLRVRLDTGDAQPWALRLYRSRGYVEIPDYNANPFASHWFERELTTP
jgi:GNAT superfamily N-acetyltransferase